MKTTPHLIGDRVSVRCKRRYPSYPCLRPGQTEESWLGGRIIGAEPASAAGTSGAAGRNPGTGATGEARYVVQLDDDRRVVAWDDDVRRWTLAFHVCETLEKMAS